MCKEWIYKKWQKCYTASSSPPTLPCFFLLMWKKHILFLKSIVFLSSYKFCSLFNLGKHEQPSHSNQFQPVRKRSSYMVEQYAAWTYAFELVNKFVITWKCIEKDSYQTKHWSKETVSIRGFRCNAVLFWTLTTFPHLCVHLLIRLHNYVFSC